MNTPCPGCAVYIPVSARVCPRCEAPADTTSEMLPFRHDEGSSGLMAQGVARELRSGAPPARQDLLDAFFDGIDCIEIHTLQAAGPVHTIAGAEALQKLHAVMQIRPADWFLMSISDTTFVSYRDGAEVERLGMAANGILRSDRWKGEAGLRNPSRLAGVLAELGYDGMQRSIAADIARAKEAAQRREAWKATWEPAIPPFLRGLMALRERDPSAARPSDALIMAAFAEQTPDAGDRIRLLLAWYGHRIAGAWSGYPAIEALPERLLMTHTAEEIFSAVEADPLTDAQWEGITRLVGRYPSSKAWCRALHERARRSPVREQLRRFAKRGPHARLRRRGIARALREE